MAGHLEEGLEIVHDAVRLQLFGPHALLQAKIDHVEAQSRGPAGEAVFTKLGRAEVRIVYSPGKVNVEHERQVLNQLSRVKQAGGYGVDKVSRILKYYKI